MAYALTLGTRFHLAPRHTTLVQALLAAYASLDSGMPVFMYDDVAMVAAVGRGGSIQVYDSTLYREGRWSPATKHRQFASRTSTIPWALAGRPTLSRRRR